MATLFAAATVLYSALWMYYVRQPPWAWLGIEVEYEATDLALRATQVTEGSPAQQARCWTPWSRPSFSSAAPSRKTT